MHAVERVLDSWKAKKNVKYFLVICESKDPSIHCNSFSKLAVFSTSVERFPANLLKNIELLKRY